MMSGNRLKCFVGGFEADRARRSLVGIYAGSFLEPAVTAKTGCQVSRALAAVPEITLEASLPP